MSIQSRGGRRLAWGAAVCCPLIVPVLWGTFGPAGPRQLFFCTFASLLLIALLAASCVTDLLWHKIPNWATYSATASALVLNAWASSCLGIDSSHFLITFPASVHIAPGFDFHLVEPIGIVQSAMGAGAAFLVMLLAYQFVGSGAGDVKLATAIGAFVGPEKGLTVLVWCHLTAGIVILAWMIWTVGPMTIGAALARRMGASLVPALVSPPSPEADRLLSRPVPLAAFFSVGTCLALWKEFCA